MILRMLGTSDGLAGPRRANSAALLQADSGGSLLIDCGEPVSATLLRLGVDPDSIEGLVLTHLHADHSGGFTQLIQTFQLRRRQRPFRVFMPEEGIEPFSMLLRTVYLYSSILPFELRILPVHPGRTLETPSFRLRGYPNEHLGGYRAVAEREGFPAPCESFSIAVSAEGRRAVFSGDLRHMEELRKLLEERTDLLVSELIHFPASEAAVLLPFEIGRIVFTHFRNTPEGVPADADDPLWKQFSCPVLFADDLREINF